MDSSFWKKVVQTVANTDPDEIGCRECYAHLDQFVEQVRTEESADDVMPRVRAHLERCKDCREEYEALLDALRATE